jgi:hypothetical protein
MFLFLSMGINAYLFYRWSQETDKKRFLLYKIASEEKQNPLFRAEQSWKNKFSYIFPIDKNGWPSWYTEELKKVKKELK